MTVIILSSYEKKNDCAIFLKHNIIFIIIFSWKKKWLCSIFQLIIIFIKIWKQNKKLYVFSLLINFYKVGLNLLMIKFQFYFSFINPFRILKERPQNIIKYSFKFLYIYGCLYNNLNPFNRLYFYYLMMN